LRLSWIKTPSMRGVVIHDNDRAVSPGAEVI
jgi:hypothetical protein